MTIHDDIAEPDPVYGDQIQDRAILGIEPEGSVGTIYTEEDNWNLS